MLKLYDTTLRDGTQAEDIAFSVEDKVRVAKRLDGLGVHYIEGGFPGSNPRDIEFFKAMQGERLVHARLVSFGPTRRPGIKAKDDKNLKALVSSGTDGVTIFGKSWRLHVQKALRVSMDENLEMIFDTVDYLKKKFAEVIYDAEHFFDGYKDDPEYALKTLKAAEDAGADYLVLCDTNGGSLPFEVASIVGDVLENTSSPTGIHAHNDTECAVANSLMAIRQGARMVHGTINGYGERCGNANLCSIIPALKLKMNFNCVTDEQLRGLREAARFVQELANLSPYKHQPYVGDSAFAHKGGVHVSAVVKSPETYEHIRPELVGNRQRILVSDLSGKSNIVCKAAEYGLNVRSDSEAVRQTLNELKALEHQGFQYEGAEASFELLMQKALKKRESYFRLLGFRVIDEKKKDGEPPYSEATIRLEAGGVVEHTAAEGHGPVNALDRALRKALERFYPSLKEVRLLDFKVRVLGGLSGTASKVRVLVESGDERDKWGTVGVSENVIEASWQAIVDSLEYKLFKDKKQAKKR